MGKPQSPKCTSLTTDQPFRRKRRCRESPMIAERKMSDMHRLGDVRTAEIDDRAFSSAAFGKACVRCRGESLQARFQRPIRELQIDEPRTCYFHPFEKRRLLQLLRDLLRNGARIGFCKF